MQLISRNYVPRNFQEITDDMTSEEKASVQPYIKDLEKRQKRLQRLIREEQDTIQALIEEIEDSIQHERRLNQR
jgi:phosphopantetheine adenylyltransferase